MCSLIFSLYMVHSLVLTSFTVVKWNETSETEMLLGNMNFKTCILLITDTYPVNVQLYSKRMGRRQIISSRYTTLRMLDS